MVDVMNKFNWFKLSVLAFTFAPLSARAQKSPSQKTSPIYSLQLVKSVALPDLKGTASEIAFSGNGKIAGVKVGGKLFTFDAKTWKLLHVFTPNFEPTLNQWALSPGGKTVALVHYKQDNSWSLRSGITLEIRNARTGQLRQNLFQSDMPNYVAYSPDGKNLVTLSNYRALDANEAKYHGETKTIGCWNAKTGVLKWSSYSRQPDLKSAFNPVFDVEWYAEIYNSCGLAFTRDSQTLATEFNGQVELRAMNSGKKRLTITDERGAQAPLIFSADGKTLVTGGDIASYGWYDDPDDDTTPYHATTLCGTKIWNTQTGKKQREIAPDEDAPGYICTSISFWPKQSTLLAMSYGSGPLIFDVNSGVTLGKQELNFTFTPLIPALTPDHKFLVTATTKAKNIVLSYWKAR